MKKQTEDAMAAFIAANPKSQYQDALDYLHSSGHKINRHGSADLYGKWKTIRNSLGLKPKLIMSAQQSAEQERMTVCFPGVASVKNSPEW